MIEPHVPSICGLVEARRRTSSRAAALTEFREATTSVRGEPDGSEH